jgi:hypothetical protein
MVSNDLGPGADRPAEDSVCSLSEASGTSPEGATSAEGAQEQDPAAPVTEQDEDSKIGKKPFTRRKFVVLGATGAAVAGVAGAAIIAPALTRTLTQTETEPPPEQPVSQPDASYSTKSLRIGGDEVPKAAPGSAGDTETADTDVGAESDVTASESDSDRPDTGATTSSGTGGSGTSGGGTTTPAKKVWHPAWDEWVSSGYYETQYVHHDAQRGTRTIYGDRCNECGAVLEGGQAVAHLEQTGHFGYSTGVPVGTEEYLVREAWDEAIQVWVDTSHNVHHEGYWE